jgi:hypothetical protein
MELWGTRSHQLILGLKIANKFLLTQPLGNVTQGDQLAVVIGQNHHRFVPTRGIKHLFPSGIAAVNVN